MSDAPDDGVHASELIGGSCRRLALTGPRE